MATGRHNDALRAHLKLINEWKEESALIAVTASDTFEGPALEDVFDTPSHQRLPKGFLGDAAFINDTTGQVIKFGDDHYGEMLSMEMVEALESCDTYYVTDEMCAVVQHARESIPEGEVLHGNELMTKHGFVFFETPLRYKDSLGSEKLMKALMWRTSEVLVHSVPHNGVTLYPFTYRHEDILADPTRPEDWERAVSGTLTLQDIKAWGFSVPWHIEEDHTLQCSPNCEHSQDDDIAVHPSQAEFRKLLLTLWRIMSELVYVVASQRQTRRQAERKVKLRNPGEIRVVQLRRADYRYTRRREGEEEREGYDHRFEVRGHWRNQWYPSEGVHRQIWITKYIKGPDDKPLVLKDRIFKLER